MGEILARSRSRAASPGAGSLVALVGPSLVLVLGCNRGPLPDYGFGTASGAGETEAASASGGSSPSTSASGETLGDDWGGEGPGPGSGPGTSASGEGDPGDGDPSGGQDDPSGGQDDPSGGGDGDGDWGGDTWGVPPDVTNEPCDPLAQECFPTHKCVPFASDENSTFLDANKCMPIEGDKGWGEACTLSGWHEAQDDCDGEGFCWNLEWHQGQLHGTCVPFCVGTPQNLMCPAGWGCLFSGAVALCSKQCDPLVQDCPLDYGCYWSGGAFDCALTATPAGPKQACDSYNDCLPGLACVDKILVPGCQGNDPNCCTQWCDLGGPDPCAPPLSCVGFFAPQQAPPMFADVGVCVAP